MREIDIISAYNTDLSQNAKLMRYFGCENSPHAENQEYFSMHGDFWIDCDKVKFEGITLDWNWCNPCALLAFDPIQYPDHVSLIEQWIRERYPADAEESALSKRFAYDQYDNTWQKWEDSASGIAYRGGSGYTYGIYVYTE